MRWRRCAEEPLLRSASRVTSPLALPLLLSLEVTACEALRDPVSRSTECPDL